MRLHRLTVEAFGPFPEEVVVDFDALGADGLFLVHGPTGAGKTSLLDAVCFALYGSVPGARRETRQALHSHHADPSRVPRVTLELTAAGRRLRIERQPEFARPKKRGTGVTRTPAKVVMTELVDGTWVDRGNGRHDDVAQIVDDVIGLGLAQFQTVVLLPQGDFASFLRADTTARAEVLARLFDTGRYDDIQSWLESRRRETEAAVRVEREELRLALARAADAAATVPATAPTAVAVQDTLDLGDSPTGAETPPSGPLVDPEATDPDAVHAALTRTGAWLHSVARAASTRATEAGASLAVARRAREQGEGIARMRADAARAQAALDALTAAQPAVDAEHARLALAERAAAVAGHLAAVDAERTAHDKAQGVIRALPTELVDPQTATRHAADLAAHDDDVARLLDLATRRRTAARDLTTRVQALDRGRRDLARAEEAAEHAATQADSLFAQVTAAQTAAAHEPALNDLTTRIDRLVAVHAGLDQARASLDRARTGHTNAQTAVAQAQRIAADLGRARADGLAAELALTLTDGAPCPVCGAHEHPAPAATADGALVSVEDVAAAEERLADAGAAATRTAALVAAAEARLEERSADLETHLTAARQALTALTTGEGHDAVLDVDPDGPLDPEHAQRLLTTTRAALATARQQARRATELDDRRAELLAAAEDAAAHGARSREHLAALTAAHEAAAAAVIAVDDELRTAARTHDACPCHDRTHRTEHGAAPATDADDLFTQLTTTDDRHPADSDIGPLVDAIVVRHRQQVAAAAAALAAHAELSRRGDALDQAQQRLRNALALVDLDDEQAVREALLTDAERAACSRRVQEHTEQVLREKAVLQQDAVVAALHAPAPDLDQLTQAEHTHAEAARAATEAHALARHAASTFELAADAAGITLDRLGPALHSAAVVREVADTAAGTGPNNTLRMSLSTFVLAARLEEVVRLANERLAVMTGGRYELRHSDALAARGKRSGLGLEVLDAWSGVARDTKTLSGGETFMASLALALGLGDAVRAESGGLELETLFVDEGFGTLDDEALEQVMTVLDGLREGGRSVGIVSHVAELRTRIPSQLRLVRTQHGSRVETHTGLRAP